MRECFECAVLVPPQAAAGVPPWARLLEPASARLRLHPFDLAEDAASGADPATLIASAALRLQRYDACLLPVEPGCLPWARVALLRAGGVLRTPVLALCHGVRAPALADLFQLGVADFVRAPMCGEELRARLSRMAVHRLGVPGVAAELHAWDMGLGPQAVDPQTVGVREASPAYPGASRTPQLRHYAGASADGRSPASFLQSAARPLGASRSRTQDTVAARADAARLVARLADDREPFGQAKARVVDGFEREYLRQALARHHGNVAQAARASCKHRRAFWALMRKHRIEASPFRGHTDADADRPASS